MKTLLLLTTLLTAAHPSGDPLSDLYLRKFLGVKITPKKISKTFFEVILAKKFNKDALKILLSRKNLILVDISKYREKSNYQN